MAPRLNSRKSTPKSAPAPREAVIGDNSDPHGEEAERVQLISFVSKITQADAEVESTKGPYDAAKTKRRSIIKLAEAAGFSAARIRARMDEMNRSPVENDNIQAEERRHRRWLGTAREKQDKLPLEKQDEMDWQSRGYQDGIRGKPATLPEGIPPRMDQPYLKGHETGFKEYLGAQAAMVPKPKGASADEIARTAAADFKADNPDVDLDNAARKLKGSAFMDTNVPVIVDDDPLGVNDGFEATDDELSAQKPRQAIVDAAEGRTSGEEIM